MTAKRAHAMTSSATALGAAIALMMSGCGSPGPIGVETQPAAAPAATPISDPDEAASWRAFVPDEQGFFVELPGAPQRVDESVSSIVGPQTIVRYRGTSETVLFYEVGYLKRNNHPLTKLASTKQILNAARRGTLDHFGASESSRVTSALQGHSSELLDVDLTVADEPVHGRLMLILTTDRIYHVLVVPRPGSETPDEGRRILESFVLDA